MSFFNFSFSCLLLLSFQLSFAANNATYEQRRLDYIDSCILASGGEKLALQAYKGLPLDTALLNAKLSSISNGTTSDFRIIEMVRILFLTNGTYDAQILPVLNSVPYWINYGDTVRNYWSENHMIMWMSSDWLLHEKYNRPIDATLHARLLHYLELKVQFGFYEFFSSTYAPYSLSGLLNLSDFAQDAQIKSMAEQAAQRLLTDLLKFTNDKGTYYPVAGRNYPSKYENPYNQNHNNLIFLLTGFGEAPTGASAAGQFLSTSDLPVDNVISSWTPDLDTMWYVGHSLDTGFIINAAMSSVDKTVFQWSSGAYFHPSVVSQTVQLLVDSNMWGQVDFELLRPLSNIITPSSAPLLSNSLSMISKSSVICGQYVQLFKHHSITLSSVPDFWKGKVGFQQHVCVANLGTTAVYLGSGTPMLNWSNRNPDCANVHLPYVAQKKNVALLMYRPEATPELIGPSYSNKDVALHFWDNDFDEVQNDSMWLLGRQDQNYVAVRRSCIGEINNVRACETNGGQSWVIMVGDSGMYGNFSNFQNIVHQSQFEEEWYFDSLNSKYVYYAKIIVDTISIDYAWAEDSVTSTGIRSIANTTDLLRVYPNPVKDVLTVQLVDATKTVVSLKITDAIGRVVFADSRRQTSHQVNVKDLTSGVYFITLETEDGVTTQKFLKE